MSDQKIFQSNSATKKLVPPRMPISGSSGGVERSTEGIKTSEVVTSDSQEIDLPNEIKEAGVEKIPNEGTIIEIPPDLKKLGMSPSGPTAPVSPSTSQAKFPIADRQLVKDSKGPITSALTWLAIWCIKRFKKMHLAFITINGKSERVEKN